MSLNDYDIINNQTLLAIMKDVDVKYVLFMIVNES